MYDVVIIGAGIIGGAIARELSRYQLQMAVLERSSDAANGATKANSAIVHAGYDAPEGSLMARLNVAGNQMYPQLCRELSVPFQGCGSLVLAFSDEDERHLQKLLQRGQANRVPDLRIIPAQELLRLEPQVNPEVRSALLAPSASIVGPWELCLALLENAAVNGAELRLEQEVIDIEKTPPGFRVLTRQTEFETRAIINAAGAFADRIHNMVAQPSYRIRPRRGQYFVMDKSQGELVQHVIFQCPSSFGKGILVAPTVHGNLLLGPDAEDLDERDNTATTAEELELIRNKVAHSIPAIQFRESIRNFAGLRAQSDRDDFIIEEARDVEHFFDVAGIKSPGLSAAPAIGVHLAEILATRLDLQANPNFIAERRQQVFMQLGDEEKQTLVAREPSFGRIICRCEGITEGEIVEAIQRPAGARTLDGVKKRCRPGMGRCQGGFCGPRVQEILARELGLPLEDIMQDEKGSYILTGSTK